MKETKFRKTGKTQLKKLLFQFAQIIEVHEPEICDKTGCKNKVAGHVLLRFGALGLCKKHLAEHRAVHQIIDDYNHELGTCL